MAKAVKKPVVTFKYIFSDDYNAKYANGVIGGVTPRGEIEMNFFLERHALPFSTTHSVEEGSLGVEISTVPKDLKNSLVRFIDTGVVMNLEQAKSFNDWLGDKIKMVESVIEESED